MQMRLLRVPVLADHRQARHLHSPRSRGLGPCFGSHQSDQPAGPLRTDRQSPAQHVSRDRPLAGRSLDESQIDHAPRLSMYEEATNRVVGHFPAVHNRARTMERSAGRRHGGPGAQQSQHQDEERSFKRRWAGMLAQCSQALASSAVKPLHCSMPIRALLFEVRPRRIVRWWTLHGHTPTVWTSPTCYDARGDGLVVAKRLRYRDL